MNEQEIWDASFTQQIAQHAYNMVPPEVIVRHVMYYLRSRYEETHWPTLRALDLGCGRGATSLFLAGLGLDVTALDISPVALEAIETFLRERRDLLIQLHPQLGSASALSAPDASFDIVVEANVLQHVEAYPQAFKEIVRVLKPGGLFAGYLMATGSMQGGKTGPGYYRADIPYCHYFNETELQHLLRDFADVQMTSCIYTLPREEAERRGVAYYQNCFFAPFAIR